MSLFSLCFVLCLEFKLEQGHNNKSYSVNDFQAKKEELLNFECGVFTWGFDVLLT